jgi:hypothetical protein
MLFVSPQDLQKPKVKSLAYAHFREYWDTLSSRRRAYARPIACFHLLGFLRSLYIQESLVMQTAMSCWR